MMNGSAARALTQRSQSADKVLQRAMERDLPGRMTAISGSSWALWRSFEDLAPDDDTLGTDDVPAFLETYEHEAAGWGPGSSSEAIAGWEAGL